MTDDRGRSGAEDWNVHEGIAPHVQDLEPPAGVVAFLSGSRRGAMVRLAGERLRIGTDSACEIRIPMDTEPLPKPHHATLVRAGPTWELTAEKGTEVWVNGRSVTSAELVTGDLLEIGRDGAMLRYREQGRGASPYKSVPEVLADCVESARAHRSWTAKATALAVGVPRDLATQTSRHFRGIVVVMLLVLGFSIAFLVRRSFALEERLLAEVERVEGLNDLMERAQSQEVSQEELAELLTALQSTSERVEALEAREDAPARVIARTSRSTVFLQGAYRFVDPESGRPLRRILLPDGRPLVNPAGEPALSLEGDGPPLEIFVTGTAFIISEDGRVLTNRHVAVPWEFDPAARGILQAGFRGVMTGFVGYLPGFAEPFDVELVSASDEADLAVLKGSEVTGDVPFLELADDPPAPGDEVVVLGYPLGLRALLARSDADFVRTLQDEGVVDFWEQARRLARAGFIAPLASQGIVGQVTTQSVVYDAETTSGGSGGPVLTLDGRVVAINTAVLPEFGGSNLGVPAPKARSLLREGDPESR